MSASIDAEHLPYLVELDLVASDTDVHCEAVRLSARDGGKPVTARGLRDVPLGECIRFVVAGMLRPVIKKPGSITIPLGGGIGDVAGEFELADTGKKRQKRVLTDEHLREVARVYLAAEGKKPTQAVQNHPCWAPQTYSTAARWVYEARHRDDPLTGKKYLGPVPKKGGDDA
jgi:hypothetical protein